MQLSEFLSSVKILFNPLTFVEKLNRQVCNDSMGDKFALNLVLLDPLNDQVTYISCGFGDLLHVPQGHSSARKLSSQNDLLGVSATTEFSETCDNWNAGDLLILHSLHLNKDAPSPQVDQLGDALNSAVSENLLLSAQRQAEAIFKMTSAALASVPYPKAMITIQRII